VRVLLSQLEAISKHRPSGYVEDCLSRGKVSGSFLEIGEKEYRELKVKYRPEKSFPPLTTQIKNAGNAAKRVISASLRGEQVYASPEEMDRRKAICANCEYWKDNRCLQCGCLLKAKIKLQTESCPVGKWKQ
jgi:hypothetical protein